MADYDAFAPDYDLWSADMTEDVAWYVDLARDAAEPIVELGVGSGRIAIEIARETGKRVIGIDRSRAMMEIGRERAETLPVEFREGDMRELALEEQVELVICPFRAFLHLPTWADRRRTVERVAAALRPGGRFAFNVFAFSGTIAARLDGQWQDRGDSWEIARYVWADNRIDIARGRGREEIGVLPLWWISREMAWVARKPA